MIDLYKYFNSDGDTLEQFLNKNGLDLTIDTGNVGKGLVRCDTLQDSQKQNKHNSGFYALSAYSHTAIGCYVGVWQQTGKDGLVYTGFTKETSAQDRLLASDYFKKEFKEKKLQADIDKEANRQTSLAIFSKAPLANTYSSQHEYLKRKRVNTYDDLRMLTPEQAKENGINTSRNLLLIPSYKNGGLHGVQYIYNNGFKIFAPGCSGGTYQFGPDSNTVFIGEGFATCASFFEATGYSTICSFNCHNLKIITEQTHLADSDKIIYIIEDNDLNNKGQEEANKCLKVGAKGIIHIPQLINQTTNALISTDANDIVCAEPTKEDGLEKLKTIVESEVERANLDYEIALAERKRNSKLLTSSQFLAKRKPTRWLVKNWLSEGSQFAMLFGASGSGKTFISLDLALSIAYGLEWKGRKVNKAKVLYLCAEGEETVRLRYLAWLQEHNEEPNDANIMWKEEATYFVQDGIDNLINDININNFKPELIIVDTLSRHIVGNENNAVEANTFIQQSKRLQDSFNAFVLVVHHTGWNDTEHARGSTAFLGACDWQYSVSKSKENIITLKMVKNKRGKHPLPINFELKDVQLDGYFDDDGEPETSAILQATDIVPTVYSQFNITDELYTKVKDVYKAVGEENGKGGAFIQRDKLKNYLKTKYDSKAVSDMLSHIKNMLIGQCIKKKILKPYALDLENRPTDKTKYFITDEVKNQIIQDIKQEQAKEYKQQTLELT